MAENGRGSTHYVDQYDFYRMYVKKFLENTGYVRIQDALQDDLAVHEADDDATLTFIWEGPKGLVSLFPSAINGWALEVDEVWYGLGSPEVAWTALVRLPAGVHKISISPWGPHEAFVAEAGAAYEARMAIGKRGTEFRVERTG